MSDPQLSGRSPVFVPVPLKVATVALHLVTALAANLAAAQRATRQDLPSPEQHRESSTTLVTHILSCTTPTRCSSYGTVIRSVYLLKRQPAFLDPSIFE